MPRRLAALALLLSACGMSYTLDEQEGIDVATAAFNRHTIYPGSTRPIGPMTIDEVELTFTVDRWSLADKLGFEYVSDGDPDFTTAATDLGDSAEVGKLQTAVDEALAAEPGAHVLVLRTWGHETYELAAEQLDRYVEAWLIEQGR